MPRMSRRSRGVIVSREHARHVRRARGRGPKFEVPGTSNPELLIVPVTHMRHNRTALPQDAQKGRPARPQRVKGRGVPFGYVEGLNDARTKLAGFFNSLLAQRLPAGLFRKTGAVDVCVAYGAVAIFYAVDVCLAVHILLVYTFHQGPEPQRIHMLLPGDV